MHTKTVLRLLAATVIAVCTMTGAVFATDITAPPEVLEYNHKQHGQARTDETALSVCSETADTYSGPWGYTAFSYDDPDDTLSSEAHHVTFFCDTDEEKAKEIHDWIAEAIAYDKDSLHNNTQTDEKLRPLTVYYEGMGNCEGYTNLMVAMLREVGVPAKKVLGYALGEGTPNVWPDELFTQSGKPLLKANHAWTEVWFDDEWHIYDVTWDSKNIYENGERTELPFAETYCDILIDEFSKTHLILDNGDKTIPDKATYELAKKRFAIVALRKSVLENVKENNRQKHTLSREDSTALAVYGETSDTYTGPWNNKPAERITYDDPDDSISKLSEQLTRDCKNDEDKAKKLYSWVANNISYDMDMFNAGTHTDEDAKADIVLSRRRGVCDGYSNLMVALLREAGIPAKTVSGYALGMKEPTSWPNDMFAAGSAPIITNHSWTEAYFDNKWHSYDVTWDSRNIYENGTVTRKPAESKYCDITLAKLSQDHYIIDNCDGYLPSRQEYKVRKRECEIMAQVEKLEQEIAGMSDAAMRTHLSGQPQSVIHKMSDNVRSVIYNEAGRKERPVKPVMIALKFSNSSIMLDAYNIGGYTYFKIGDIAYAMIHQNKCFSASWDNINRVWYLSSDTRHTPVKGDAVTGGPKYTSGKYEAPSVNKDGTNINLGCYTIGGNQYFKLRDIGRVFNFAVYWDGTNVCINPALPYQAEAVT